MLTADALPRRFQVPFTCNPGVRMCVHIRFAARPGRLIYDDHTGVITLPSALDNSHRVTAARAVLSELHVPQPQFGAVCWCGEPVSTLPRVPEQRRSEQVVKHGA